MQTVIDATHKETTIDQQQQLWNADISTSSNHTKAFVQCCHGKHTASSRTLLSDHVCEWEGVGVVQLPQLVR